MAEKGYRLFQGNIQESFSRPRSYDRMSFKTQRRARIVTADCANRPSPHSDIADSIGYPAVNVLMTFVRAWAGSVLK